MLSKFAALQLGLGREHRRHAVHGGSNSHGTPSPQLRSSIWKCYIECPAIRLNAFRRVAVELLARLSLPCGWLALDRPRASQDFTCALLVGTEHGRPRPRHRPRHQPRRQHQHQHQLHHDVVIQACSVRAPRRLNYVLLVTVLTSLSWLVFFLDASSLEVCRRHRFALLCWDAGLKSI